jgi:2-C-methyl-D-erythritol 4-phosphate cytidylyltransferase
MDILINASNFKELKKQLRQLQGKAIFELTRTNSIKDGKFNRVLYKVNAHDIIFFDGVQTTILNIPEHNENIIQYFENGFTVANCAYELITLMEA